MAFCYFLVPQPSKKRPKCKPSIEQKAGTMFGPPRPGGLDTGAILAGKETIRSRTLGTSPGLSNH